MLGAQEEFAFWEMGCGDHKYTAPMTNPIIKHPTDSKTVNHQFRSKGWFI
jgi:hypothetical protein